MPRFFYNFNLFLQIPKGFIVNEEIELGVVIGKTCKNVPENKVMEYVAGYCVALDLTATSELVIIIFFVYAIG